MMYGTASVDSYSFWICLQGSVPKVHIESNHLTGIVPCHTKQAPQNMEAKWGHNRLCKCDMVTQTNVFWPQLGVHADLEKRRQGSEHHKARRKRADRVCSLRGYVLETRQQRASLLLEMRGRRFQAHPLRTRDTSLRK